MKQNYYFRRTLSALLLLMASSLSWAYDFEAENADGVTIYYNLINDGTEAEVTYIYEWITSYSDEIINIPSTVEYGDKTLSVTSIGDDAFSGCRGLTSVTIPNSVTSIGSNAFSQCSGLTSVTIPNSVTIIGKMAFAFCSSLTSITILADVTSIGDYAFEYCSSLTSVNIPESVTSIGDYAFRGCLSLTSVNIPETVTSIGDGAFDECSGLTSITIPESVTSIGDGAFAYCSSLTSIIVNEGNPVYDSRGNCNAIIETASNTLLTGCQNTIIHGSVTGIGESAFSGCSGLTSITIPESVKSIGDDAFRDCSSLISITIPESVTTIGSYAFRDCLSLTSITIPNSVTSIGWSAFQYCSGLTSVYSLIENPFDISDAFYGIADDATLYVPQGTKSAYEAIYNWTRYFKNVVEFDATGISDVKPVQSAESDAVYDLNGVRVERPAKGIYIKNGKKVMIK